MSCGLKNRFSLAKQSIGYSKQVLQLEIEKKSRSEKRK